MVVVEVWESAFGHGQFERASQVIVYKIDYNTFVNTAILATQGL